MRHVFTRMLEKAELRHIRVHDLRHTFASLLLQQGESVVYVKEQLGHGSIQITVDTYGHLIPGANRAAVDRLDDDVPTQPDATQAQPEPFDDAGTVAEMEELFGKSGEPPRNRTENPQIKSLFGTKKRDILRIYSVRSANHGTAPPIDGADTAPAFRACR